MPFWLATLAVRVPSPTASAAQSDLVAAFRRRIAEVNDLSALGGEALVPLVVDGARVGELRASLASELGERWPDVFRRDPDRDVLALAPSLSDADARTAAVAGVTAALRDDGTFSKGWRDDLCAVGAAFDAPPAFSIERACYPAFGVKGYGIHVNAYCVDPSTGERQLWVATRSRQKSTWPGMLDNLVAGQQPAELSLYQNVVKEAGEEAGIPEEIARRAKSVGVCSYRGVDEWGQLKIADDYYGIANNPSLCRDNGKIDPERPTKWAQGVAVGPSFAGRGYMWANSFPLNSQMNTILPPNKELCMWWTWGGEGTMPPSSQHQGGAHVLMGDGAVIFITDSIEAGDSRAQSVYYWGQRAGSKSPYGLWGAMGTRANKEVIEEQLNQ